MRLPARGGDDLVDRRTLGRPQHGDELGLLRALALFALRGRRNAAGRGFCRARARRHRGVFGRSAAIVRPVLGFDADGVETGIGDVEQDCAGVMSFRQIRSGAASALVWLSVAVSATSPREMRAPTTLVTAPPRRLAGSGTTLRPSRWEAALRITSWVSESVVIIVSVVSGRAGCEPFYEVEPASRRACPGGAASMAFGSRCIASLE
jgi:hypothetical protein